MAGRESSEDYGEEIDLVGNGEKRAPVYVKYMDHVLLKNCSSVEMRPCIREVIGWLVAEDPNGIFLCVDRPVTPLAHEEIRAEALLLLKCAIVEMRKVRIKKPFNRSRISYCGHKRP